MLYGPENYKVHSKLLLIKRKNRGKIETFTQIGTGNYNEKTAAIYTDYCLMTSDPQIGADAENVFAALRQNQLPEPQQELLVAPFGLQSAVLDMSKLTDILSRFYRCVNEKYHKKSWKS